MSNYGRPDFFVPPSPGGQIIAGSKGYPANTITFYPQDVSAFTSFGVRLLPTGVITGYMMTVDFYADAAATKLVDEYVWWSYQGAAIIDKVTPPAPWMKCTVTPAATGGGQTLDIWLLGFGGGAPSQLSAAAGIIQSDQRSVGAGAADMRYCTQVRSGPAQIVLETTGTNWYSEVTALDHVGGSEGFSFRGDQATYGNRVNQTVILGRGTYRFYYSNADAVAATVVRSIISA